MKPKCSLSLNICCLDCEHSVLDKHDSKLICEVADSEYCGFEWYMKDCGDCPHKTEK